MRSVGWDANLERSATWVELRVVQTGKKLFIFNTHFDYKGKVARDESAKLMLAKIGEIARDNPYVLTGDLNLFPSIGGEETYRILTGSDALVDAQKAALFPHHGPTGSWSGFKEPGTPGIKPDYIFVSPKIEVYLHGILTDTFNGEFPSDHLPLIADINLL